MQSRKLIINSAGIILFLAAGAAAMFLTDHKDQPAQTSAPSPTPQPTTWYIYVTGAVNSPGVYTLSEDSRIFQAIESAGGFSSKADHTAVNLAEPLQDGAHVHVPARGEGGRNITTTPPSPTPKPKAEQTQSGLYISGKTSSGRSTSAGMIDVNHASAKELEQLNGIGSAISKRIVEYRQAHGRFNTPEDLINVRGIGAAKLEKMRSQILIR